MLKNNKLQVNYIETKTIKPYKRNTRIHVDKHIDEIVSSINVFKFTNPILIDENYIIIPICLIINFNLLLLDI